MKSMITVLALIFSVVGCSSSNNDSNSGPQTPFQKVSGGQWLSDCNQDNTGFYKETLVLNGTNGTSTSEYYNANDCSGAVARKDGPTAFTYSSVNKAGGKDGEATVTLNYPGKQPVTVEVIVQGDVMVIIAPSGNMIYRRIGGGPVQKPIEGNPGTAAFDAVARGNWMTRDCKVSNGVSYFQILTIHGQGRAQSVINVYQNTQCQGTPTPQNHAEIRYDVNRFANGGGQLTIDGNAIVDVSINGPVMTLTGAAGTTVFQKIN